MIDGIGGDPRIEIIREQCSALSGGDWETFASALDPEVVFDDRLSMRPDTRGVYHGPGQVVEMLKLLTEGWEKWELEPVEISHLDGDRYLFVGRMTITGRGSGVPVSAGGARTYVFNDDDKIVRSIFFQNREDAAGSAAPQL